MKDWNGNSNSIWKTLGASNHTDKERQTEDFYATDPIAIDKLWSVEDIGPNVWECAAGNGDLSKRMRYLGLDVCSTDIIERDFPLDKKLDFLTATKEDVPFQGKCDIITNPPYRYAKEFVLKGLELLSEGSVLCLFLKLTFLEGVGRHKEIFSKTPPRNIYVFSQRVLCAKNGEFERMKAGGGSAVAYAWFVWQKGYEKSPEIGWI